MWSEGGCVRTQLLTRVVASLNADNYRLAVQGSFESFAIEQLLKLVGVAIKPTLNKVQ